jgi:hypothetical protein
MQEPLLIILTSSNRILLADANLNTLTLKGVEERTYTTSAVNGEKTGDYFKNALSQEHIWDFSITRKNFKLAGGTLTIQLLGGSVAMTYNTKAVTTYCGACGSPTTSTLTSCEGLTLSVCQKLSVADFGLLVLATASPRILLATDEGCLGWSSATTGSLSLEKGKMWYNIFYVR